MKFKVRFINAEFRYGCGEAVVIDEPVTYLGDVDTERGTIKGVYVKDRVVLLRVAVGSTVGSYLIYGLSKKGFKPKAILISKADPVTIIGAILGEITLAELGEELFSKLSPIVQGRRVCLDPLEGWVVVEEAGVPHSH